MSCSLKFNSFQCLFQSIQLNTIYLLLLVSRIKSVGNIERYFIVNFLLIYLLFAVWTIQGELKQLVDIMETRCIETGWVWVSVKENYWRNQVYILACEGRGGGLCTQAIYMHKQLEAILPWLYARKCFTLYYIAWIMYFGSPISREL